MNDAAPARGDLVLLVADLDMQEGLTALLRRHQSLGIRPLEFHILRHPERDAGCRARGHELLRPLTGSYRRALVVFDRDGCGSQASAPQIEDEVKSKLERNGWPDRAEVVVIDPELEAWVWSASPVVGHCLQWEGTPLSLRDWLAQRGFWEEGSAKPSDPKGAVEAVCAITGRKRRAEMYAELAEAVSTRGCQDRAFGRFRDVLRRWFPPE